VRHSILPVNSTSREVTDYFRGYNHNLRINGNEFFDMKNMTSDHYPVLAPRKGRGTYAKPASPQALIAKDQVCYVDGENFVIGNDAISIGLSTAPDKCPKQLVSMGAYVIILPDKKYINTMNPEEYGDVEAKFETVDDVTFRSCTASGDSFDAVVSPTAPENPANLDYWIDTGSDPHSLKQWAESSGQWVSVSATYIRIGSTGIGKDFNQYDGVQISGIQSEKLKDLNGNVLIQDRGDDYLIVSGLLDEVITQKLASVTVHRQMPNLDYVIESGNRLWGCRYGMDVNGQQVNEIYACKLGDFRNWSCFMGLSTDSYTASCGTDGPFTGAVSHLGYPLFWKENCVHKIYGSYPAQYQIQDTACRGVQKGCHKSLAIVNEILYYKSRTGICAFDGSLPKDASYALGPDVYGNAVAGACGNKYYVSMQDTAGGWNLFVLDTAKGLWHKEDDLHAVEFCAYAGELYCIDGEDRNIITMLGSGEPYEDFVPWMVETGELGIADPDMKYISRILIRLSVDPGSQVDVYVQYDLSDEWLHICNIRSSNLRSFAVPIRPRRCDHMKLRFVGTGMGKIYSWAKTIERGSEHS
jgi:hypothetical protein